MNEKSQNIKKEWDKFSHLFKQKEIATKTILLREGQISKNAFHIKKGCIRSWFNNEGKDISFQFFFEGSGVSSVESFRSGQPSLFNLESIEPCVIDSISKKDFQYILSQSPILKNEIEEQIFKRLIFYQHLFLSRIKNTPQERYLELIKQHPEIVKRVPHKYIASYLGMNPTNFSKLYNSVRF